MNVTEALEDFAADASKVEQNPIAALLVTSALLSALVEEQGCSASQVRVGGFPVRAYDETAGGYRIDIPGNDRVSVICEGADPEQYPLGFDPGRLVAFAPVPPARVDSETELAMYVRLRWMGIPPEEAIINIGV